MSLLGQIVAGEAGGIAGQQAVLNVLMNRAAINFGGYGTTLLDQATAYKQFSAYPNALGSPTANTEAMVAAAQNGTLGNIVPDSLNYANPMLHGPLPVLHVPGGPVHEPGPIDGSCC
jgi:Cell Wall Hydrolase